MESTITHFFEVEVPPSPYGVPEVRRHRYLGESEAYYNTTDRRISKSRCHVSEAEAILAAMELSRNRLKSLEKLSRDHKAQQEKWQERLRGMKAK